MVFNAAVAWDGSQIMLAYMQYTLRGSFGGVNANKTDLRLTYLKPGIKGSYCIV